MIVSDRAFDDSKLLHGKRQPRGARSERFANFAYACTPLPRTALNRNQGLSELLSYRLDVLQRAGGPWLGQRGVERESLRVDDQGVLAQTPHAQALGSALTHPHITTDYSEALLELITAPHASTEDMLVELTLVHRYVQHCLGKESLWAASMPAALPADDQIPIAWYGNSHIGMLKHVYRRGLALRYGRAMQCIAGIHYNFSVPEGLWEVLRKNEGSLQSLKDFQSDRYIALIRNFQRRSWLLMLLTGASPALSEGFLQGRAHQLQSLGEDTLYLPYATSLRMSDLGYQNNAQAGLIPPYNTLQEYMTGMAQAVGKPWPAYEALGLQRNGEWWQISTNVLQIENEYYASIRPKRVTRPGERPLQALCERGVQYVEVRCIDVDPFEPTGISLQTARFLDVFLMHCALVESIPIDETRMREYRGNFALAVNEGRKPGLLLQHEGDPMPASVIGLELLEEMRPVAQWLDRQLTAPNLGLHEAALDAQVERLRDPALLPSARVLDAVEQAGGSFHRFALAQSQANREALLAQPLSPAELAKMQTMASESLAEQARMESTDQGSFDEFIEAYRAAMPNGLCR